MDVVDLPCPEPHCSGRLTIRAEIKEFPVGPWQSPMLILCITFHCDQEGEIAVDEYSPVISAVESIDFHSITN